MIWVTSIGINDSKPSMTIHFEEADLVLKSNAVSQKVGDPLLSSPAILMDQIYLASQQANNHFLFDVSKFILSFILEKCNE